MFNSFCELRKWCTENQSVMKKSRSTAMFQAMFLTEDVGPLPWVHRSRQVPASAWTLHGVTDCSTSGYSSMGCSMWCGCLLPHGPPWAAGGQLVAPSLTELNRIQSDAWLLWWNKISLYLTAVLKGLFCGTILTVLGPVLLLTSETIWKLTFHLCLIKIIFFHR